MKTCPTVVRARVGARRGRRCLRTVTTALDRRLLSNVHRTTGSGRIPNQAIQARYFTGPEQDALGEMTPSRGNGGISEPRWRGEGSQSWPGSMALS